MTNKDLAEQVEARERFLKEILPFIETMVLKYGTILDRKVSSSNINTTRRLDNFGGFSFITDCGQTMFGGNDINVWFCRSVGQVVTPVLSVHYQIALEDKDLQVTRFDDSPYWQTAMRDMFRNKDLTIANYEAYLLSVRLQKEELLRDEADRIDLLARAKNLGLA